MQHTVYGLPSAAKGMRRIINSSRPWQPTEFQFMGEKELKRADNEGCQYTTNRTATENLSILIHKIYITLWSLKV
jgi:hypothetical protein